MAGNFVSHPAGAGVPFSAVSQDAPEADSRVVHRNYGKEGFIDRTGPPKISGRLAIAGVARP